MIIVHLLPFPVRGITAPHLWIFYKAIARFGQDAVYWVSEAYLADPSDLANAGRSEPTEAAAAHMRYAVPSAETLSGLECAIIPHEVGERFLAESGGSWNLGWRRYLTEESPALTGWYRTQLDALVRAQRKPRAILTWCNCPSLKAAAKEHGIALIHAELGALRRPDYLHTTYFDRGGVNGDTEAAMRYSVWAMTAKPPMCSLAELQSLMGASPLPAVTQEYSIGIPLQVEDDSNIVAFSQGFDNQALINLARSGASPDDILVRSHPASQFRFGGSAGQSDASPTVAHFIAACRELLTVNSSVGVEAMLYGKRVRAMGDAPYAFVAEVPVGSDEFLRRLSFFCLNYLVPETFLFDAEYIAWRLQEPPEAAIRARHVAALLQAAEARSQQLLAQAQEATAPPQAARPGDVAVVSTRSVIYHATAAETFGEERTAACDMLVGTGLHTLRWALPAGVTQLRLDPAEMPCVVTVEDIVLTDTHGEPCWRWPREDAGLVVDPAQLIVRMQDALPATIDLVCVGADPHCGLLLPGEAWQAMATQATVLTMSVHAALLKTVEVTAEDVSARLDALAACIDGLKADKATAERDLLAAKTQMESVREECVSLHGLVASQGRSARASQGALREAGRQLALEIRKRHLSENYMNHILGSAPTTSHARGRVGRRRQHLPLPMQPVSGVEPLGERLGYWEAVNDDPQFEISLFNAFEGQWIRFSVEIEPDAAWCSSPMLYMDCGLGYTEQGAVVLPRPSLGDTRIEYIFNVPRGALRARFDPIAQSGTFRLGTPHVQALGKLGAVWLIVRELARSMGWKSLLRDSGRFIATAPTPKRLRTHMRHLVDHYQQQRLVQPNSYSAWISAFEPRPSSYPALAAEQAGWTERPLISVVMPVYNPPIDVLRSALESVQSQIYPNWELCIADDASPGPHVMSVLNEFAKQDSRIKVVLRSSNGHIVAASNSALELATGTFVALMDHDDLLHPLALHYVAEAIVRNPGVGLLFSDEDKVDEQGVRYDPYFKCEFNYELMLAHNMVSHLGVYRRSLLSKIGGFRKGFEGSQDYDLALRSIEELDGKHVVHIPRVLYHWRAIQGSTALAAEEKPYATQIARKVIAEHLQRRGMEAEVVPAPEAPNMNRVRFAMPNPAPLVSIIIPTRDRADLLAMCVDSILAKTTYSHFEIIIVDNGSVEPATMKLFSRLPTDRVRVLRDESPFNFSALNNRAVAEARGLLVCLMNNDIEVITPGWLEEMVSFAHQKGIGCVGARLWYPDGRLQHGGVITGLGGVAEHSHKLVTRGEAGYFGRAVLHQSFSAVTAACLLIRTEVFREVDGLDEALQVAFNDVDFCLRVQRAGYRNVWTPYAEMVHYESASRGQETTPEKRERFEGEMRLMYERWGDRLENDPAYSPNLTLEAHNFALAWPPRNLSV